MTTKADIRRRSAVRSVGLAGAVFLRRSAGTLLGQPLHACTATVGEYERKPDSKGAPPRPTESTPIDRCCLSPEVPSAERDISQYGNSIHNRPTSVEGVEQLPKVEPEDPHQVPDHVDSAVMPWSNLVNPFNGSFKRAVEGVDDPGIFGCSVLRDQVGLRHRVHQGVGQDVIACRTVGQRRDGNLGYAESCEVAFIQSEGSQTAT